MTNKTIWLAVATLLAVAAPNIVRAADTECLISLGAIKAKLPQFSQYPTHLDRGLKPAPARIVTKDDRMFRTAIRRGAAVGPNFAGHYTVATWGCGAGGLMWTIVDARTGRVEPVGGCQVAIDLDDPPDDAPGDFWQLRFRPDSRLLILLGAKDGTDEQPGVRYYEWTGARLKPIAQFSQSQSCVQRPVP